MDYKKNSFDFLRLLACISVALGHAIVYLEIDIPALTHVLHCLPGVPIFFCISGFLISLSLDRNQYSFREYFKRRVFRIYPELWGSMIISTICLLIFQYINKANALLYALFVVAQSTIVQFWTPAFLRGYGAGTPNGALWTISLIILFNIVLFPLYKLLKKLTYLGWGLLFLLMMCLNILPAYMQFLLPDKLYSLYTATFSPYLYMFMIGAFLCIKRDQMIPLLVQYTYPILAAIVVVYAFNISIEGIYLNPFLGILLCVGTVAVAYKWKRMNVKVELSYGIYIYHMIIINVMIQLHIVGQAWYLLIVLLASGICAYGSRKLFVESLQGSFMRKKLGV